MQTLITKAQQIRDAQVTLATHAPTVTPPPAPLAPVGPVTAAEMQARFDRIDLDGNGTLNVNDFQQMQNEYAACTAWAAMTPTNLQASVQGQQVILSWVGGINADTIEVIRDNVTVQTLAGSATTYTDSPGPGAHSWMTRASGTLGSANIYQGKLSNAVTATVQGTVPVSGWTDLTPASGGVVVYVSSSTGNDSNTGTQTAPFRTLAHGYQALRDGHPDQLLLKCGDTWTEGLSWQKGGASGAPMVMASYGTGARPAIRGGIYGGQQNKGWVIFADLDVQPAGGVGTAGNAFLFFAPWHDITIEGNYIAGFNVNIVVQEVDASRSQNIRIRRNVIADAAGGSGHNQGLFMGSCDGTVIEENVFDLNGNYPGFEKADMFCHSCYLHETNGPSTFNGNITARACSHGVQQRSGGLMTENLALQNPIDLFQGNASNVSNSFTLNVAIDSRDINPATPRGIGFELYCPVGSVVLNNVAAKNISGTQNTDAFSIAGTATVKFNAVNDWKQPVSPFYWGTAFHFNGATIVEFSGNHANQHGSLIFQGSPGNNCHDNTYASDLTSPLPCNGHSIDQQVAAETGSLHSALAAIDVSVEAYMASIGLTGGLPEFMAQARLQSKQNWIPQFTTAIVNRWVRNKMGVVQPPAP